MNERLFELIEETVAIYMKRNLNGTVPQRDYLFQEIFTELIVRECADVIKESVSTMEHGKLKASITHAGTLIKEHFGVKE